ncbi:MAG: hypothetical protein AAFP17_09805 [Pseudomonadota bacterium]
MGNVIKVVGGLAAIIFVLLAFGPGGFMTGGGDGTGVGTIGIAEEHKKRQQAKAGGGSAQRGVADERFVDAPGDFSQKGGGGSDANAGSAQGGGGGKEEYDFFGTLARVLGFSG